MEDTKDGRGNTYTPFRPVAIGVKSETAQNATKLYKQKNTTEAESRLMTHVLGPTNHVGNPVDGDIRFQKDPELLVGDIYGLNRVEEDDDMPTPFELQQQKEKEAMDREVDAIKDAQAEKLRLAQLAAEKEERTRLLQDAESKLTPNCASVKNGAKNPPKVRFQVKIIETGGLRQSLKQVEEHRQANPLSNLKRRKK